MKISLPKSRDLHGSQPDQIIIFRVFKRLESGRSSVDSIDEILKSPFNANFKSDHQVWALVSCCLNLSYITFHNCSWAALSALRFFYIARKDWLLQQFTERQIIYILLSIISGLVIICYSTFFGVLTYANYSYMWPDKSFLSELRPQEKSKASFLL